MSSNQKVKESPPNQKPEKRDISKVRLDRELEILNRAARFDFKHYPQEYYIVVNKIIKITYGPHFPFEPP